MISKPQCGLPYETIKKDVWEVLRPIFVAARDSTGNLLCLGLA